MISRAQRKKKKKGARQQLQQQKEFNIKEKEFKVCTLGWTFLHDLGQITGAKPELLDQGDPGSLECPQGQTGSDPSLLSSFQ